MEFLELLQFAGSLGFTIALVPQFIRTLRRRRAEDVDVAFLGLVLISSGVLLYYAAATRQWWFAMSFFANLVVWGTVLFFRLKPGPASPP